MRVVELSRLRQFTLLREGGRKSPHVGERRRECKAGEDLRDTGLHDVVLLVPLPVTCGKGRFQASSDRLVPHRFDQWEHPSVRV